MTAQESSRLSFWQLFVAFKNSPALLGASALANVYVTSVLLSIEPNASWIVVPLVAVSVYVLDDVTDRAGRGAGVTRTDGPDSDGIDTDGTGVDGADAVGTGVSVPLSAETGDDVEVEPASREAFYSRPLLVGAIAIGGYVVAVGIAAVFGGPVGAGLTLVPGVAGVLYSLPAPSIGRSRRLKEVFVLNTALIAAAIAIPGTLLPVAFSPDPVSRSATAALVVFWFVRYAVGVETCNVPDLDDDRRSGVSTLSTRYGVSTTRSILYAGDALAIVVLLAFVLPESDAVPVALVCSLLVVSMAFTALLGRPRYQKPICVAWDALHVAMGVVVAAGVTLAGVL